MIKQKQIIRISYHASILMLQLFFQLNFIHHCIVADDGNNKCNDIDNGVVIIKIPKQ